MGNALVAFLFFVVIAPICVAYACACMVINALLWPLNLLYIVSGCKRRCTDFKKLVALPNDPSVDQVRGGDRVAIKGFDQDAVCNNDREKVVLMGDSVLDDFIWLRNPQVNLRMCVEESFVEQKINAVCANLAVDQMTTFDFIRRSRRGNSWDHYAHARKQYAWENEHDKRYLESADGNYYSLEVLKQCKKVSHIVVSCGGNDVYLGANIQSQLFLSLLPFQAYRRNRVGRDFCRRLNTIFRALREVKPSAVIVPVIVYEPHHSFSISGLNGGWKGKVATTLQRLLLPTLVRPMVVSFLKLAEVYKLPVIDLSRTLNASKVAHYGNMDKSHVSDFVPWSGAEPSDVSQKFIADLIAHVVANFQPDRDGSRVYYGVPDPSNASNPRLQHIRSEKNCGNYSFHYQFGARSGYNAWVLRRFYSA